MNWKQRSILIANMILLTLIYGFMFVAMWAALAETPR